MIPFIRRCCRLVAHRIEQKQEMFLVFAATCMTCCKRLYRSASRQRALHLLALLCLMLTWLPAQATDYTFPGNLPAGCAGGSGSYSCGALVIAAGDTISVAVPTILSVSGAFITGAASRINAGGVASDLFIRVAGAVDLGATSTIIANLISAGVVNLGSNATFVGDIKTLTAAINVGSFSMVSGSIATLVAGAVNIGAGSRVIGNITTASGAINVGAGSNITGFILSTIAGAITIGQDVVTGGSVGSSAGAITLGVASRTDSSTCTGLAGAITLNDNAIVGGNVTASVGAIVVAANAKIGGVASKFNCPFDITSLAAGVTPPALVIKSREWRQIFMR